MILFGRSLPLFFMVLLGNDIFHCTKVSTSYYNANQIKEMPNFFPKKGDKRAAQFWAMKPGIYSMLRDKYICSSAQEKYANPNFQHFACTRPYFCRVPFQVVPKIIIHLFKIQYQNLPICNVYFNMGLSSQKINIQNERLPIDNISLRMEIAEYIAVPDNKSDFYTN